MHLTDHLEKIARLTLWLVLSAVLVVGFAVVPLQYVRQRSSEADLQAALGEAKTKLAKAVAERDQPEDQRLALESLGPMIHALNYKTARGMLWFTNVSSRRGIVCAAGIAKNQETQQTTESLATCREVQPYSSAELEFMFAGGDLGRICPSGAGCAFSVQDVPDITPSVLARADASTPKGP